MKPKAVGIAPHWGGLTFLPFETIMRMSKPGPFRPLSKEPSKLGKSKSIGVRLESLHLMHQNQLCAKGFTQNLSSRGYEERARGHHRQWHIAECFWSLPRRHR